MILNSPTISGSLTVTGNIISSGSITLSGSVASASYATSASNATNAISASYANAFTVAGTLTAQTLVVQTITSSVDFVTGSTRFGSILGNTHVFSGSVTMNPGGLFVSSSGLVGIGNVIPAYTLDVSGTGRYLTATTVPLTVETTGGNSGLIIKTSSSTTNWLLGGQYNIVNGFEITPSTAVGGTTFSTPALVVKNTGNVGIGTSSPLRNLIVKQSVNSYLGGLAVEQSDNLSYLGIFNDGSLWNIAASYNSGGSYQPIGFYTGDVERMRITSGGNVAINAGGNLQLYRPDSSSPSTSWYWNIYMDSSNLLNFGINGGTGKMVINASGNIQMGTTTDYGRLTVFYSDANNNGISINETTGAAGTNLMLLKSNTATKGSITINVTNTGVNYNVTSDYRLKEDLKDFNGLEIVSKIKTYDFKWKNTEYRDYGVMAHELQEVLPLIVSGKKDAIEEDGSIKLQGVDYGKLTTVLVKAIQELKTQNDALQSRIETLESK
jgi:hypothetical protein